ncbi:MAG: hypothetical protein ABH879_06660 [archaeon]
METTELLNALFDQKKLGILRQFLRDREKQFYLREIAGLANVSVASTFRIVNQLVAIGVVEQIKVGKFKVYQIGTNDMVRFLESFIKEAKQILSVFVDKAKLLVGAERIILHGKETESRANVLLIGEGIDANEVKRICSEIREKYKFTVSSLTLSPDQFDQMSTMGLYSGEKKVLFVRS